MSSFIKKTAFKFAHFWTITTSSMVRLALFYAFLTVLFISLTGCETLRTIGQGVNNSVDRTSRAVACVSVGLYPCAALAAVSGYAEGKEQTRDKIRLEKQADVATEQDKGFWDKLFFW